MPPYDIIARTEIEPSFRVAQLSSIFDLPVKTHIEHKWRYNDEIKLEDEWNIGLIVGPSGSGKSILLKHLFPNECQHEWEWTNRAIIDDVGADKKIQDVTEVFSSVGFSSPPSWLKPYHVLSNGEKFRVELARSILDSGDFFVCDEFSSVVDRDIAKVTSFAISKAIRKYNRKMIAASCHYDICEWLNPDWIYDLRDNTLSRRLHRRPEIEIEICQIQNGAWDIFRQHHYLSGNLHRAAKCFGAFWNDNLVAFCAVFSRIGKKGWRRIHRLVVLPDYQGVGIGSSLLQSVAEYYKKELAIDMSITSSHPSIMKGLSKKKEWRLSAMYKYGSGKQTGWVAGQNINRGDTKTMGGRMGSPLATYEYIGKF